MHAGTKSSLSGSTIVQKSDDARDMAKTSRVRITIVLIRQWLANNMNLASTF